jgi:hypothetical protein
MERYKLPAGRLATIFYKGNPRVDVPVASSDSLGNEKGTLDPDVPPKTSTVMMADETAHIHSVSSHHGRTLSWNNITLDLKAQGEVRRLLDGLSGKLQRTAICSPHKQALTGSSHAGFAEPGQLTALMGASGAGKVCSTGFPHDRLIDHMQY